MDLGTTISRLRVERHMSQGDLAEALDVSRQSISKWETNASVPELDKLVKLSRLFGVSLDELVTGEAPSTPEPVVKTDVTAEDLRLHRQKLLGIALLVSAVILCSFGDLLYGVVFVWPLLVCGVLCLLCKKPLGLICGWGAWLTLFGILGPSLIFFHSGTRLDDLLAFCLVVPLLLLTAGTLRHPPAVPVCWLLLAAAVYQYRNTWFLLEPVGYLELFHFSQLPSGGRFLTLYLLAAFMLLLIHTAYLLWKKLNDRQAR